MRPPGPYPLQALLRLRQKIRDQRQQALAEAVQRLQLAEIAEQQARERMDTHLDRLQAEQRKVADGGQRQAAELQAQQRYLQRLTKELEPLRDQWNAARQQLQQKQQAFSSVQQALARAQTELEAVERNRESWDQARRADEMRRAEQELEDVVASRTARKVGF
jgi:septation ring formation regulator EzrA